MKRSLQPDEIVFDVPGAKLVLTFYMPDGTQQVMTFADIDKLSREELWTQINTLQGQILLARRNGSSRKLLEAM